jgi:hypothetical protein
MTSRSDLQAFPVPPAIMDGPDISHPTEGMTLRDYFAAKAMQGLIASGWESDHREMSPNTGSISVAVDAYVMADAMLKARDGSH